MEIINATDGYKLGHHRMYPEGTQMVYSNWTPRSNRYFPEATEGSVVFGIQYFVKKYLIEEFNKWFALPKEEAIKQFAYRVGNFVDLNQVGTKHIEELYDLGYLPIEIKALPEGPIRVPMMTIKNTLPDFFWLTNYLETLISCTLWLLCTSATSARLYKKRLMAGLDAAIISGMTSFCGSETIPAIEAVEHYYNANVIEELVAATVPASEHSVMCAGGEDGEIETYCLELKKRMVSMSLMTSRLRIQNCKVVLKQSLQMENQ